VDARPTPTAVAGGAGARPFTAFLRRLRADGEPPDQAAFTAVWRSLRAALIGEIRRRGLWQASPSFLGVYSAATWWGGGGEPIEELLADCYAFIFLDRLRALRAQLAVRDDVDGLVRMNIRHFLHERQKQHDPLGYRVFEAVRTAVRAAIEEGELAILDGDPRVRNDTLLGVVRACGAPAAGGEVELAALVRRWNDSLLPGLITAHGRGRRALARELRRRLRDLGRAGVGAVRFRDLIEPLKCDARARWAALLQREAVEVEGDEADPERAALAPLIRPDLRVEAADTFRALIGCISERVAAFPGAEPGRRDLERLWEFTRLWSAAEGGAPLPSQRRLAVLVGIPRGRLGELLAFLRSAAAGCAGEEDRGREPL
jgi:hypothetical protein